MITAGTMKPLPVRPIDVFATTELHATPRVSNQATGTSWNEPTPRPGHGDLAAAIRTVAFERMSARLPMQPLPVTDHTR